MVLAHWLEHVNAPHECCHFRAKQWSTIINDPQALSLVMLRHSICSTGVEAHLPPFAVMGSTTPDLSVGR